MGGIAALPNDGGPMTVVQAKFAVFYEEPVLVKMLHHGVGAGSVQGLLERLASNAPFS